MTDLPTLNARAKMPCLDCAWWFMRHRALEAMGAKFLDRGIMPPKIEAVEEG